MELAPAGPDASGFWREVASTPGGESVAVCLSCDECTTTCPVEDLEPNFRVRRIISAVKAGPREAVLFDDALWACTRCFACTAACPRHARPGEILGALRHLSLEAGAEGPGPGHAIAFAKRVQEDGRVREPALRGRTSIARPRRLQSVIEVQRIFEAAEGSR